MMTEIKKCLKICKYGFQLKTNIVAGLLFMALGLLMLFLGDGYSALLGIFYLALVPLYIAQISCSVLYSNMLLSSSLRKALDGSFPNVWGAVASAFAFVMTYVGLLVNPNMRTVSVAESGNNMIAAGIAIAAIMMYMGVVYKFFIGSIVVFSIITIGVMAGGCILLEMVQPTSLLVGSIIGLLIAVAGNVLGCILRAAVYKRSMDPLAGGASLRKALK